MIQIGRLSISARRCGAVLCVELAGSLAAEDSIKAARELWMLADASDASVIALDRRRMSSWLPLGQVRLLAAMRPPPVRAQVWCLLANQSDTARAEAFARAFGFSGDFFEVFSSESLVHAWSSS